MTDDLLILPPQRAMSPKELERRREHLILEARATLPPPRRMGRRRVVQIALAAALVIALTLSSAALGVVQQFRSWLADRKGPDEPVATADDVVIASGVNGVPWDIVATQTDEGLCLFLLTRQVEARVGLGGCGWDSDILGGERHRVSGGNGSGHVGALDRIIVWGVAAEETGSVELELTNGSTVLANLVERPEGIDVPLDFFWAILGPQDGVVLRPDGSVQEPAEPLVRAIVARDSAGSVLERRDVYDPVS